MKIAGVLFLLFFGTVAFAEEHPLDSIVVNLSDGVNELEAKKIGFDHFGRMGCGAVVVEDAGDKWLAEGLAGYAANSLGFIHIDKKNGNISQISSDEGRAEKLKHEGEVQKLKARYDFE